MSLCYVGLYMNSDCNKLTYSRTVGVKYLESFKRDELELIVWRSGLTILNINATTFSSMQKTCFDPFKAHKRLLKVCSSNTSYKF